MPTLIEAEKSVLYWANQLGEGYSGSALGCPIMVDGDLIVFAREEIFKVDAISGEVLVKAAMAGASSFAINSPTYYDGMIFVGLSNGRMQAFDAQTLKSFWLYTDELGGQPNCPIIVYDSYLYTGFWNSETGNANYVCLSVTDEDPQSNTEAKVPTWTITQPGGFYWAGSCVNDDFMLLGTDDGQTSYATKAGPNKTAQLLLLNPKTGEVLDRYTGIYADQRSSICYDKETDAYYFTTKGGYFYRARVTGSASAWKISEVKPLKLNNYKEEPENPAMSTCTPVVYNDKGTNSLLDGGLLDEPEFTLDQARDAILKWLSDTPEQITEIPMDETQEILEELHTFAESRVPKALLSVPDTELPDQRLLLEDMYFFGYTKDDMYPVSKDRASELLALDVPLYMLYTSNEESMVFDQEDISLHEGIFGVTKADWEAVKNTVSAHDPERRFLDRPDDSFLIYQLKLDAPHELSFTPLDRLKEPPSHENYEVVYTGVLEERKEAGMILEDLYHTFNNDRPMDFTGHSLSIGDIVDLKQGGKVSYHYCDTIGFKELPVFSAQKQEDRPSVLEQLKSKKPKLSK